MTNGSKRSEMVLNARNLIQDLSKIYEKKHLIIWKLITLPIKFEFQQNSHPGKVIAVECDIPNSDLNFNGWPGGEQPENDIPLR